MSTRRLLSSRYLVLSSFLLASIDSFVLQLVVSPVNSSPFKTAAVAGQNSEQLSNESGNRELIYNCLNCNDHCEDHFLLFLKKIFFPRFTSSSRQKKLVMYIRLPSSLSGILAKSTFFISCLSENKQRPVTV